MWLLGACKSHLGVADVFFGDLIKCLKIWSGSASENGGWDIFVHICGDLFAGNVANEKVQKWRKSLIMRNDSVESGICESIEWRSFLQPVKYISSSKQPQSYIFWKSLRLTIVCAYFGNLNRNSIIEWKKW